MLHVEPVKAFNDNYLWVFHEEGGHEACVVDPGSLATTAWVVAGPVAAPRVVAG